jgi:hypothetical protein
MDDKPKVSDRNGDGKFAKGNPGKPVGAKSERVKMWESLGQYVVNEGAQRAMEVLAQMDDDQFLEQYMKMLEYFKPKQARVTHAGDAEAPVQIIVPKDL